jgi:serine/threonine protein phosphatase PrpC
MKLRVSVTNSRVTLPPPLFTDASIDTEFSGTTCVLGTIRDKRLTVINIGDSRIILGRKTASGRYEAVEVSDDHKPDRPDEQKRIESRGGRVFAVEYDDGIDGPARVWLGHMDIPGLAMSRSLGDTVAHTAGVLSSPEYHKVDLTASDKVRPSLSSIFSCRHYFVFLLLGLVYSV